MTPDASREPLSPGSPGRKQSEHLRDCADLLALLADELEALEQRDFPKLRELSLLRAKLEGELRKEAGDDVSPHRLLADRIEEALTRLEEWAEQDARTRDQLSRLQQGSLPLVWGIESPPRGRYPAADLGSGKLDLRF